MQIFHIFFLAIVANLYCGDSLSTANDASEDTQEVRSIVPVQYTADVAELTRLKTVITFGTFDLFHIGHLKILERAKNLGDKLIVGISSDAFNFAKKGKYPQINQENRAAIVSSLKCVDEIFFEESFEKKGEYLDKYQADILVMGDDWLGKFNDIRPNVQIIYLPRTLDISTTEIIEAIREPVKQKFIYNPYFPNLALGVYQMVYDFQNVMDYCAIPFFFSSGTLLGAVRHGGMIPWDDDADGCLLEEYIEIFVNKAIPILKKLDYQINLQGQCWSGFKMGPLNKNGGCFDGRSYLDVFIMKKNSADEYHYPTGWPHMKLTGSQIFPLKKVKFGSVEINAPNDITDFLNQNFGINWPTHAKKYNHFLQQITEEEPLTQQDFLPLGPLEFLTDNLVKIVEMNENWEDELERLYFLNHHTKNIPLSSPIYLTAKLGTLSVYLKESEQTFGEGVLIKFTAKKPLKSEPYKIKLLTECDYLERKKTSSTLFIKLIKDQEISIIPYNNNIIEFSLPSVYEQDFRIIPMFDFEKTLNLPYFMKSFEIQ